MPRRKQNYPKRLKCEYHALVVVLDSSSARMREFVVCQWLSVKCLSTVPSCERLFTEAPGGRGCCEVLTEGSGKLLLLDSPRLWRGCRSERAERGTSIPWNTTICCLVWRHQSKLSLRNVNQLSGRLCGAFAINLAARPSSFAFIVNVFVQQSKQRCGIEFDRLRSRSID